MNVTTIEKDGTKRRKPYHTTLERISSQMLPAFAQRFLFSQAQEFPILRFFMGAAFGAVSGAGLFIALMYNTPMSIVQRLISAYVFVGLFILGGAFSSYFRCSVLMMFPCVFSSRGRAYLLVFVLYSLFQGPISNIHRNVEDVAFSMGCNIELQIKHSKVMWRVVIDPFMKVVQDIVDDTEVIQDEAKNVSKRFQKIREEVMGGYGYHTLNQEATMTGNSTQDIFVAKTKKRCDFVVEQGIDRCREWFHAKWQECMDVIKAPLINHLLCVPMQFHFLCDIMRVMTSWCRDEIPVEGNFGKIYDKLNASINRLGLDFTTTVVLKKTEQQSLLGETVLPEEFSEELSKAFNEKKAVAEHILEVFQILLSCTFIFVFFSAFRYVGQYNQDIRFDNMYITTYFRQIDARRKKAGKRYLLPLKKVERANFINPWSFSIHSTELKFLALGMLQFLSLGFFMGMLLAIDWILYRIFEIIRRHTIMEYSFTSSHHIEINVGGTSMLAVLLRKTIGAFNTTSNLDMKSNNKDCLPHPRALSQKDYLLCFVPLLMMALMCCVQVYSNRLRRVIAAFYFPKREKKRALFLYNLSIQRQISFVDVQRRRLMGRGRPQKTVFSVILPLMWKLGFRLQWCCVCGDCQRGSRGVKCTVSGCQSVYCSQCWRNLGGFCFACAPYTQNIPAESWSDTESCYVE